MTIAEYLFDHAEGSATLNGRKGTGIADGEQIEAGLHFGRDEFLKKFHPATGHRVGTKYVVVAHPQGDFDDGIQPVRDTCGCPVNSPREIHRGGPGLSETLDIGAGGGFIAVLHREGDPEGSGDPECWCSANRQALDSVDELVDGGDMKNFDLTGKQSLVNERDGGIATDACRNPVNCAHCSSFLSRCATIFSTQS